MILRSASGAVVFLDDVCDYCGMVDCTMCVPSTDAEGTPPGEPGMHTMAGIPPSLAIGGLVFIILVSHLILARRRHRDTPKNYPRIRLMNFGPFKAFVRRPWFPMAMQGVSVFLFLLVLAAGLFGSQRTNIAPVLTWTWWWALLIFFVAGFGKVFCTICPWEGISSMVTSLSLRSRVKKIGLDLRWPKSMRNVYPAMGLFILLTWLELGFDITRSPSMTALMGVGFVALAIIIAILYERRAFCRYVCLVGRIQGLYAMFGPVEVRPESRDVCRTCVGKECYKGTETEVGCPTHLFPGSLNDNTYCTLCTECVRSCPHDNIGVNLRPFATDLVRRARFRWDEAVLAIVLLALTSFHGLTMTPYWGRMTNFLRVEFDLGPKVVFTILMIVMIILPALLFWLTARVAAWLTSGSGISTAKILKAFAYSVLPVALFYHLAHNGMHFFMEAQYIIPLLSDPFGLGWDLFGTAGDRYPPWMKLRTIWWLQISLIVVGHVFGVIVADRVARKLFADPRQAFRSLAPLIVTMILYSGFSVWLIAQPMEMRSGM